MPKKQYIIEGKTWNGVNMRVIEGRGNAAVDVVDNGSTRYEDPIIFDQPEHAQLALENAQAIATACELSIVEFKG